MEIRLVEIRLVAVNSLSPATNSECSAGLMLPSASYTSVLAGQLW